MDLTIICVYYNKAQYEQYLGKSLKKQTYSDYQLLLIDNSKAAYRNMHDAVLSASTEVQGAYVMLVHPDISFPDETTLREMMNCVRSNAETYRIFGSAGATKDYLCAAVTHGDSGFRPGREATELLEVQTLDECLVILPRAIFDKYPLADLGETWHLYIVELCLQLRRDGYRAAVMPVPAVHWSNGTITLNFFCTRFRVAWRYRRDVQRIETTCGSFSTGLRYIFCGFPHDLYWLFMRDAKRFILKNLPCLSFVFRFTARVRELRNSRR